MGKSKPIKHYNAINVEDETYERFMIYLRTIVIKNGGHFVTQEEAMKNILDKLEVLKS